MDAQTTAVTGYGFGALTGERLTVLTDGSARRGDGTISDADPTALTWRTCDHVDNVASASGIRRYGGTLSARVFNAAPEHAWKTAFTFEEFVHKMAGDKADAILAAVEARTIVDAAA